MTTSTHMTGDLVLVTGARGFIGWHVAAALLGAGAKVRGLTRSLKAPVPGIDPGIDWFKGDLSQPDTLAIREAVEYFRLKGMT